MTNTVTTPTVSDIIAWAEENTPSQAVQKVTIPVATLTWVQAALRVLPTDGTEMHISKIMEGIVTGQLRATAQVATPMQTLRRDLNVESRRKTARVSNTRRGYYARAN